MRLGPSSLKIVQTAIVVIWRIPSSAATDSYGVGRTPFIWRKPQPPSGSVFRPEFSHCLGAALAPSHPRSVDSLSAYRFLRHTQIAQSAELIAALEPPNAPKPPRGFGHPEPFGLKVSPGGVPHEGTLRKSSRPSGPARPAFPRQKRCHHARSS